jgi:hypothetical protein
MSYANGLCDCVFGGVPPKSNKTERSQNFCKIDRNVPTTYDTAARGRSILAIA